MIDSSINAIIFDMDGVIADTQRIHSQVEHELLKQRGIHLHPDDISRRFSGVSGHEMFSTVFQEHGHQEKVENIVTEKRSIMENLDTALITPIPGAANLIATFHAEGFKLGLASASGLRFIDRVLTTLNLHPYFHSLSSVREVERGKPAPDVFLLAANRLQSPPSHCVVIEDGYHGMVGAKAAGMACIGFVQPHLHDPNITYPVDLLVPHLSHITIDTIAAISPTA